MLLWLIITTLGYTASIKLDKSPSNRIIGGIIGSIISIVLIIIGMEVKPEWMFRPEQTLREKATLIELSIPMRKDAEIIYSAKEANQLRNISFKTQAGEVVNKEALRLDKDIFIQEGKGERSHLLVITRIKEPFCSWIIFPQRNMREEIFEIILPGKISEKREKQERYNHTTRAKLPMRENL